MDARFHHSPASKAAEAAAPSCVSAHQGPAPGAYDRACCCVARAVVRAVMPPAPDRPHETELLLCGHHYRVSRRALAAADARVDELPGSQDDAAVWLGCR
jgi:hypothetical protein